MRIAVKDLLPNPFRKIDRYPIDQQKVDHLKESMKQTGFWDNIPVRKSKKGYEIPYGHHRLQALKDLGVTHIEAPVKDFDDATMLLMMAQENLTIYNQNPRIINETVQVAKEFIDAELARYETWDEVEGAKHSTLTSLCGSSQGFAQAKTSGAGRKMICAFLGGNWKPWQVEDALKALKDDTIDREAVEQMDTAASARFFAQQVAKHKIPKEEQREIAAKLAGSVEKKGYKSIAKAVEDHVVESVKKRANGEIRDVSTAVDEDGVEQIMRVVQRRAASLLPSLRRVGGEIQEFIAYLEQHGIQEFAGIEQLRISQELNQLCRIINRLSTVVGRDDGGEDEQSIDVF